MTEIVDKDAVEELIDKVIGKDRENRAIAMIRISAREDEGLGALTAFIRDMFCHGKIVYNDEIYITSARHKEALLEALASMRQVQASLEKEMPEDFEKQYLLWKDGKISVRQAAKALAMSHSTFYRRCMEREEESTKSL